MKISIALASYNGEAHLQEQLDSFTAQTLRPHELVIGDDGSTDRTAEIVTEFARSAPFPVHFHRNPANLGYGENFIQAALRCSGDWIAFSDQDDVWRPHKLERCAAAILEHDRGDLLSVAHSADVVGNDLQPTGKLIPADNPTGLKGPLEHDLLWVHYGFALIFRRELLDAFPPWPRIPTHFTNVNRYPHDLWISTLSNVLGETLHLSDRLALYRRHDQTVTQTGKAREGFVLADLLSTGAAYYAHVAETCRESAGCLRAHAGQVERPAWVQRLRDGAAAYEALADAYDARAALYKAPGRATRVRCLGSLVRTGAYRGLGPSSFGLKSFAKDMVVALAPAMFRA